MIKHQWQHFVPQFYFRLFSSSPEAISMLRKSNRQIIPKCSIKGQCAKDDFYGSMENERYLAGLERQFSDLLYKITQTDGEENLRRFLVDDQETYALFLFCIAVQNARTPLYRNLSRDFHRSFLESTLNMLNNAGKLSEFPQEIKFEDMIIKVDEAWAAIHSLFAFAAPAPYLMGDLKLKILNNRSVIPFVFSDNPVVLLSLLPTQTIAWGSSGLVAYYPVSPFRAIVLYDCQGYKGAYKEPLLVDIGRRDVQQLNDIQYLSSMNCIYGGQGAEAAFESISASLSSEPFQFSSLTRAIPTASGKQSFAIGMEMRPIQYNFQPKFLKLRKRLTPTKYRTTIDWGSFHHFWENNVQPSLMKLYGIPISSKYSQN